MDDILKEIQELKRQQIAFNNLMIETRKQNDMIFVILRDLLSELRGAKEKSSEEEVLEGILERLEVLIEKLNTVNR